MAVGGHGQDRDRGHGRCLGRGRGVGSGHSFTSDKGLHHCSHYGCNNHVFEKCLLKFGKLDWALVSIERLRLKFLFQLVGFF